MDSSWIFDIQWKKASKSSFEGNCVMVGQIGNEVRVRNSRDEIGKGQVLTFTLPEWEAFKHGVKGGEFDNL